MDIGGIFYLAHEAAFSGNHTYKVAAVIVKGGSVISVGHNRTESNPSAYYGQSVHAEFDAIRKARGDLRGAKMYVYRFAREDHSLKTSKPCKYCQYEIAKAGISPVVFVDVDGELTKESFKDADPCHEHYMHNITGNDLWYFE